MNWYGKRSEKSEENTLGKAQPIIRSQNPLYCILLAYQKLFDKPKTKQLRSRAFLGQLLGGFNGELIQWKVGLSLPIDEPIGLTPYRGFTHRVAEAVGKENE